LALSAEQLGRLEEIKARLAAANEPLVARIMSLRNQWQRERRAAGRTGRAVDDERVERLRTTAERVRTRIQNNNRTAMRSVNQLLTPEQRQRLREFVQERRQQNSGRRAGGGSNAGVDD
jgi:Spy/CpxP family protein refolding chaperone